MAAPPLIDHTRTTGLRTVRRPRPPLKRFSLAWWLSQAAMTFGLLIFLLLAWQIAAWIAPNPQIPSPAIILGYTWQLFIAGGAQGMSSETAWFGHALPTVGRALLGFLLGCFWGIVLGIFTGLSRVFRYTTSWVVEFLRAIPTSAVLPLFIVLMGGTDWMRVAFISYGLSLYVLINTASGVASVDPTLILTGRAFRLSRPAIVWRIILPAAQPAIWAGIRIATIGATILAIVSEFMVATNGIGYQIQYNVGRFNLPAMWAWIVFLAIFGLILNFVVEGTERRVLRWHRNSH